YTIPYRDFFFSSRRRHTRLQGDWSSDVCSSDLRVDFSRVNGFYEGTLSKEANELSGTWTQNNTAQPLSFKRTETGSAQKTDSTRSEERRVGKECRCRRTP